MKIQNNFIKGKMNKDVDERLIQKGEYIEAYNIRILNTAASDAGAIENEKGNVKRSIITASNNPVCIGSIADDSEEKIYWFVVNNDGYSYIYEYDVQSQVTAVVLADERPANTQVLAFNVKYKITGVNLIYNAAKNSKLLLWTDGLNPPRMLDIKRAKTYGVSGFIEDDISLYKKPPRYAPVVTPYNTSEETENAVKERFYAFGYRYKYLDGGYSAPSSFTYYQFTPGTFAIEYAEMRNLGMENIFNGYRITYNSGDKRVTDIQLLFKFPGEATLYVIDNVNKKESNINDNSNQSYEFVNKKIFKTLPQDEVYRIFDDVPLTAKAQDFINNRVVFGNTTSQYDLLESVSSTSPIDIDYEVDFVSTSQAENTLEGTINLPSTQITFDLSGYNLTRGTLFSCTFNLYSDQVLGPPPYFNGLAKITGGFLLSETYASVADLVASQEFVDFLDALNGSFESAAVTTSPPDTDLVTFGLITLSSSTSTTFSLTLPTVIHRVDNTPADPNDNDFTNFTEVWKYSGVLANNLVINSQSTNRSLKSNRSYEVGIVYLDNHGRYSSVLLPKESTQSNASEIFVPVENSTDINKLQITVKNPAPYWADRYKFFVKTNKQNHYNIYATVFYEDGLDRWVLLEGTNIKKVEAGQTLIVKADQDGPLTDLVKVVVLDVVTKGKQDWVADTEGWISNNKNFVGDPLIEESGTFMKIRISGFRMDFNELNVQTYKKSFTAGFGEEFSASAIKLLLTPLGPVSERVYGDLTAGAITGGDVGLLQYYDDTAAVGSQFVGQSLFSGSRVKLIFTFGKRAKKFKFEQEFFVNGNYSTDNTQNALVEFLDAETSFVRTDGNGVVLNIAQGQYFDHDNATRFTIPSNITGEEFYLYVYLEDATKKWLCHFQSSEGITFIEKGTVRGRIDVTINESVVVFETDPDEIDNEVYYETEETFDIQSGYHQGNEQNQDALNDAIVSLDFGNCFSFGNGVESVRVFDDRFYPQLSIESRPNIVLLEGYRRLNDKNRLIYSGAFNENTGYNSLNEFNTSRGITKYMDLKYGGVQKLFARESDLIVFQEDRVSKVLYGKNLISAPDATTSLAAIESVLGQDVPYSGEYGIANNPESFAFYEGKMYFTDANRGAVLVLDNQGLMPISYAGMKAFFKEFLQGNKNKFNIGGFDPRNHQYALTMTDESQLAQAFIVECGEVLSVAADNTYSYVFEISEYPGTIQIDYTTSAEINIDLVYNSVLYQNSNLTGSGNVQISVSQGDLDVTNIVNVTIRPTTTANVTLTHSCPIPETMSVFFVVVNQPEYDGQTIMNRYKINADGPLNETLDIFEYDGVTRYDAISGDMGTVTIPDNGDIVVIQSFANSDYHTGQFIDGVHRLGYLVSSSTTLTASDVRTAATYVSTTLTTSGNGTLVSGNFTFNRATQAENLFLVWDYIE